MAAAAKIQGATRVWAPLPTIDDLAKADAPRRGRPAAVVARVPLPAPPPAPEAEPAVEGMTDAEEEQLGRLFLAVMQRGGFGAVYRGYMRVAKRLARENRHLLGGWIV